MLEATESKLCLKSGLSTGLESLDKILLGLRRGEVSLLVSLPFDYSDFLASQIAIRCAQVVDCADEPVGGSTLHRVLYFSMNTTKDSDCRRRLADKGVIVDDTCGWEMNDLLMRAKREQEENGIELIVIDIIHLLYVKEPSDKGFCGSGIAREDKVAMMFKDMAKKLNVHIIVISSVTRPYVGSPGLVEISWRAGPNDAYDVIMLLERPYPECLSRRRISVLKNSHGKIGCVDVDLLVDEWRFVENRPCAHSSVCKLYRLGRENLAKGIRKESADCFLKAAEHVDVLQCNCAEAKKAYLESQYKLGMLYEVGIDVGKNLVEAMKWYRKAAENGHAEAQCKLGHYYRSGVVVEKNYVEAVAWYRKAAEQGHPYARERLARCYVRGAGVERNLEEAEKLLKKAVASAKGETDKAYLQTRYDSFVEMVLQGDGDSAYLWYRGQCSRE